MDGRQPVEGCASLYELTGSDITANNYQDLYPFGEALLASGLDYESAPDGSGVLTIHTRLAVIDQDTGKTLSETTLSDVDTPAIQVCGSTVAVCDWGLGRVFLLNEDLGPPGAGHQAQRLSARGEQLVHLLRQHRRLHGLRRGRNGTRRR